MLCRCVVVTEDRIYILITGYKYRTGTRACPPTVPDIDYRTSSGSW